MKKSSKQRTYTFRVIIEPDEGGTYHGYVPALRGCHTWGHSVEETLENIRDAMDGYLRALIADGEEIPAEKGMELVASIQLPAPAHA